MGQTGRYCKVCAHSLSQEINARLLTGEAVWRIAGDYEGISRSGLYRHANEHLTTAVNKIAKRLTNGARLEDAQVNLDITVVLQRFDKLHTDGDEIYSLAMERYHQAPTKPDAREELKLALQGLDRRARAAEAVARLVVAYRESQNQDSEHTWDQLSKRVVALPHQGEGAVIEYRPAEVEIKPKDKG